MAARIVLVIILSATLVNAGTFQTIDIPGMTNTAITGISNGRLCGTYTDTANQYHGFTYDQSGWTTVDVPGYQTYLFGIDGDNFAGLYSCTGMFGNPFLINQSGLTTFDSMHLTDITAFNGNKIVGHDGSTSYLYDGESWSQINIPGVLRPYVMDIDGDVMVGSYYASGTTYGFKYDGTNLTTYSNEILAIDGDSIVGSHNIRGSYFYTDGTNQIDFTLDSREIKYSKIYIDGLEDQTICGHYRDTNNIFHGFTYTIPEPASLILLAFGTLILKKRNHR